MVPIRQAGRIVADRGGRIPRNLAPGTSRRSSSTGGVVTEFTYGDYRDWNSELNKIEAFYAGKLVEKRNGTTLRDLTTTETETGNVYVVVPIPRSLRQAAQK